MSLKQIINQQKLIAKAATLELTLPGEPLIYCIKYPIGSRTRSVQFFRNLKWKSMLKCYFRSYYKTNTPVVLLVRFFVSSPSTVNLSAKALREEKTPAVFSYELCDYLLSFLEMLHHVLVNSYRQFVKIDVEKFYSSDPRTVFKFMSWEHYVKYQAKNTTHTEGESVSENRQVRAIQSECAGDDNIEGACKASNEGTQAVEGSSVADSALSNPGSAKLNRRKTQTAKQLAPYQKA